jgi:hypothetical protein
VSKESLRREKGKCGGRRRAATGEAIRLSGCHLTPEVDCPPSGQPGCVLRTVSSGAQMRLVDWEAEAARIIALR